jgi:hypothetical protein
MKAEISFDALALEDDQDNVEGCYRLEGDDWQVFYFTRWWEGLPEERRAKVVKNAVFSSGITGVVVNYPKEQILDKAAVMRVLSDTLGVAEWSEVRGPDSLQLK